MSGLRHENWFKEQKKKLDSFKNPFAVSRERSQKAAFKTQELLSRLERKSVITHSGSRFVVWVEKKPKKRRR